MATIDPLLSAETSIGNGGACPIIVGGARIDALEQMTTVFLPNPRISDDQQLLPVPDWSRLDLYYRLREQFLGEPMPADIEAAALAPLADADGS